MANEFDILWRELFHPSPPMFAPAELRLPPRPLWAFLPWRWEQFRQVHALRAQWVQNLTDEDVDTTIGHLTKLLYDVPIRGPRFSEASGRQGDMERRLRVLGEWLMTHRSLLSEFRAAKMFAFLNLGIPLAIQVWQLTSHVEHYAQGDPVLSTIDNAMAQFVPGPNSLGTGPVIPVQGLPRSHSSLPPKAIPTLAREMLPEMRRLGSQPAMAQVVALWERAESLGANASTEEAYNLGRILDDYIPTMARSLAMAEDSRDPRSADVSAMVVAQVRRLDHHLDTLGTPSTMDELVEALEFQDAFLRGKFPDGPPAALALPAAG